MDKRDNSYNEKLKGKKANVVLNRTSTEPEV